MDFKFCLYTSMSQLPIQNIIKDYQLKNEVIFSIISEVADSRLSLLFSSISIVLKLTIGTIFEKYLGLKAS